MSPSSSTNASSLDLTLPASALLREGTKLAHAKAEHSAGAKALARGQLDLKEYIRYLAIVWQVYVVLENELDKRSAHPMLRPSYRPEVIWRSKAIVADIEYLTTLLNGPDVQEDKPFYPIVNLPGSPPTRTPFAVPPFLRPLFITTPDQITSYQTRIVELSTHTPELLLAHAYVRYFGDLSGGQIIASKVKKMYALPGDNGTEFYEFEQQGKPDPVTGVVPSRFEQKEHVNQIKDRYRTGIDGPVGDDQELKCECWEGLDEGSRGNLSIVY
jgi:heme oxygenase